MGIDLGGTKIEGILLGPDGDTLNRTRIATPSEDYPSILRAIEQIIATLTDDPAMPVGIGTPGSLSRHSGLMRNANTTCLNGQPLLQDLHSQLGRPVRIANDADCFTLSEASDGAAAGEQIVFGIILGTGVGGGLCIGGRLLEGVNGITGEWGHNHLRLPASLLPGRACFCGKSDCNETWLSGPAIARSYLETTAQSLDAQAIAELAINGDSQAGEVMDTYYGLLASALSVVINILDPDVIVLGGGLSNIPGLCSAVAERLPAEVFSDRVSTRLLQASHGDASGVRGAAWLWP